MDLKVLMIILLYYMALSTVILIGGSSLNGMNVTGGPSGAPFDPNSELQGPGLSATYTNSSLHLTTSGLFGSGVSVTRFIGLVTIGVGLPSDTPDWAARMFTIWQFAWLTFTVGFLISAAWNG